MDSSQDFFASCIPGTEPVLEQELRELGIENGTQQHGGMSWQGSRTAAETIAGKLQTASGLFIKIGSFKVSALPELLKKTSKLPWPEYLSGEEEIEIRVSCFRSKIYHSTAAAERIKSGLEQCLGKLPEKSSHDAEKQEQHSVPRRRISAKIEHNLCSLNISIGQPDLHKHGYRLETAKAPLREDLAAGVLYACRWSADLPLVDPFCGSGTIPIEAARLARRRGENPAIYGCDRDAGAISMSRNNAERAGEIESILFSCQSVSDLRNSFDKSGLILSNPPYGKRVNSSRDLRNLYARFGDVLRSEFPGWKIGILCTAGTEGDILLGQMHLNFQSIAAFSNGGLPVSLRTAKIPNP
ncbi:THUMP domain-containing class I SAM-dependent RNA methyltransferase [Spirochaeta dissipatitropha]